MPATGVPPPDLLPLACSGRQLFFYKRAQIWAGDLYGCFRGQGLGAFADIGQLTMFAGERHARSCAVAAAAHAPVAVSWLHASCLP